MTDYEKFRDYIAKHHNNYKTIDINDKINASNNDTYVNESKVNKDTIYYFEKNVITAFKFESKIYLLHNANYLALMTAEYDNYKHVIKNFLNSQLDFSCCICYEDTRWSTCIIRCPQCSIAICDECFRKHPNQCAVCKHVYEEFNE